MIACLIYTNVELKHTVVFLGDLTSFVVFRRSQPHGLFEGHPAAAGGQLLRMEEKGRFGVRMRRSGLSG